jgi:predicted phosphodiesterase
MRVLIISDIHANLVALDAVLADTHDYEAVWCLGDLIGYGPNPNECIERVQALPNLTCLVGNHDKAVLGEIDLSVFNGDARVAISWTRQQCTAANLDYLRALPAQNRHGEFTLAHGSPRQPVWEYILDRYIAQDNFVMLPTCYCLVGHTHQPVIYREVGPYGACVEEAPDYHQPVQLDQQRLIINPGSVGQPRDNNPDAAYALLDTDSLRWRYCRVPYDVMATQSRMRTANMPERLILRLAYGW